MPGRALETQVSQQLRLPDGMQIAANCNCLLLCESRNSDSYSLPLPWIEGKIATALLQIPVEGGHMHGMLHATYRERKKVFDNSGSSDKCCYLSTFFNGCDHGIEHVS
jgi:hypothetical protein